MSDLVFFLQENGYQLLFLSARSISQAYLTRQFLFNLMQVFILSVHFLFSSSISLTSSFVFLIIAGWKGITGRTSCHIS